MADERGARLRHDVNNIKSHGKRGGSGGRTRRAGASAAAGRRIEGAGTMDQLEERIDDVLAMARGLDPEGLGEVIQSLRAARNAVIQSAHAARNPVPGLADLYEHGEELRQELLDREGGALTGAEAGQILGIAPEEVEARRAAGSLLAVAVEGRAHLYPSWQFAERATLPGFEDVLDDLRRHNDHPLALVRFFVSPNLRLGGDTPLHRLRRGRIDEVRWAARAYGEHGAA